MIVKLLFFSAIGYVAYRYIGKSNEKAKELREATSQRGRVEILPPDHAALPAATEQLREPRTTTLISPAAEDLTRRY